MKHSKYNNKKTVVDGITFDSKKEAARYGELKLLQTEGEIRYLETQPKITLQESFPDARIGLTKAGKPRTVRAITYTADFRYFDVRKNSWVIEDVKSPASKTEAYEIRKRLFLGQVKDALFLET